MVFTSCDPKSFDLPGNYVWIAPDTLFGELCFRSDGVCKASRNQYIIIPYHNILCSTCDAYSHLYRLTVQGEIGCEEKDVCVHPAESAELDHEPSGQSADDDLDLESGSGSYYEFDSEHDTPLSSENISTSEVQDQSNEFETSTCESDKQLFLSVNYNWIPHCNCKGFYAPVQCWLLQGGQLECWCSTAAKGIVIGNSRKRITCTDPAEL